MKGFIGIYAVVLSCGVLLAGVGRAADEAQVLRLRAEQLAGEGRCEEALESTRRSRELGGPAASLALLEGECAIRTHRYEDAIAPLEELRRLDPDNAQAALYLGIAHYHARDFDAAQPELDEAVRQLPNSAEAHLYRGLVLLERAEAEEAAIELQRAADLDPETDPMASFYAGQAWQAVREREQAEQALHRVIADAPGTVWAEEAGRALEASEDRYRRRGLWGRALAGAEYDSNVVLRGTGVILPDEISDQADGRAVWFFDGGGEFFRDAKWAVGLRSGYYGSAQFELSDFDIQFPTVAPHVDRSLGERTYLRLRPDFGYAWVGYSPYLLVTGTNLSLNHTWERAGVSRPLFRYEFRDYHFDNGTALDRDGNEFIGAYDHEIAFKTKTFVRGGLAANYYDSQGTEYEFAGLGVRLLGRQALPWKTLLDLRFNYRHEWYQNVSVFSRPPFGVPRKRDDDVFFVSASLERPIWKRVKLQVRYRYENSVSNVPVFDFGRSIAGAYLVYDFGSS